MNRLHHSYAGYLRSMQMSETQLFVFVEGKQCDPFFFSQICSTSLDQHLHYEIATAQQIPGDVGGKQKLITFFSLLRRKGALLSSLGGKRTVCAFILDKDIDDLQHIKKRSMHIIYTEHYDVQNYIFQHGNLVTGAAAAASIDARKLQRDLSDASDWCRQKALLWQNWIALCLRLLEDGIQSEANYRVLSPIQTRHCGSTDSQKHQDLILSLAGRANIPEAELKKKLIVSTNKVNEYFEKNEHHRIFKGKWFAAILADEVDRIMAGISYDNKNLAGKLPCSVSATLNFSEPWADYFRNALIRIVAML